MKIVLFTLLFLILIGITSYSYAQWTIPDKNTILPEVLLQMELRDSNGSLLAYAQSEQVIGFSPLELASFLDNQNQTRKEFLIKDDKKYEIQQWEIHGVTFDKRHAYSSTRLIDTIQNEFVTLLQMSHDSYQTEPGDTIRIFWTIIRPAS